MAPRTPKPDTVLNDLIRQRVRLQVLIYLERDNLALKKDLANVEQQIDQHRASNAEVNVITSYACSILWGSSIAIDQCPLMVE